VLKNKFLKIALLILVCSFFSLPSVYAYMQVMSEDDLTQVDAKNGITVVPSTDVYLQATSIGLYTTSGETSGILFPRVIIDETGNYSSPDPYTVASTTLELDVGTTSGKTWLNISGIRIYNPMAITIGQADGTQGNDNLGINMVDNSNTRYIGNLLIRGIFMGRTLTNGTTGYSPPGNTNTFTMGSLPSITVTAHSTQGLDLYASLNAYIDSLELRYRPASSTVEFHIEALYACSSFTGAAEDPSTWVGSGNLKIGNFTDPATGSTVYATMDVGTLSGKTYLNLNLPLSGSIRINDFWMDNTYNLGPIAIDGAVIKKTNVMLYAL
jgi:hypothetical protein